MTGHAKISNRAARTPFSPIRKLTPYANAARDRGVEVLQLNIGQPDLASPPEFFEAVKEFSNPVLAYQDSSGSMELRLAFSNFFNRFSLSATRPEDFIITAGGSEALIFALGVCADPNDEILIFDPMYANYQSFAVSLGIKVQPVPTSFENGFSLPSNTEIEVHLSERSRCILLCNPNNPTGTHYDRFDLERLLDLADRHNLFLILDETYRELVFDERQPVSILELCANNPRVVVIDSLSKRFSLCGARIGCLYTANQEFLRAVLAQSQARLAVSTLEQYAAAKVMGTVSENRILESVQTYQRRRDCLLDCLAKIPEIKVFSPQGAFYTIASLPVSNAERFSIFMLEQFVHNNSTTFLAPAAGFYACPNSGLNEVRLAFVLAEEKIERAIQNIALGLEAYK